MNDLLGRNADSLRNKKLFLFDMDGTVFEEDRLFEGTKELIDWIHQNGGKNVFITNNSSKSVDDYRDKLTNMGLTVDRDNFFTSSQATALYLLDKYRNKRIFCMGTKSLVKELRDYNIEVTEDKNDNAEVIVVGFDTELSYSKLRDTCELLYKGLPFLATNPDRCCPVSFGFIPDCGAICEALFFATNRRPLYIGKPSPFMVEFVVQQSIYSKDQTVVVGDRLVTDIASGINADVTSICVLSGETKWRHLENSKVKPDYVFKSVKEIFKSISRP
jgi:4-nitrophenyl phosphatase